MLRFRPPQPDASTGDLSDALAIAQMIDDAMKPGNFFVAADLHLTWIAARSETIAWEIFRGRLLDAGQTREQRTFLSWHVVEENAAESAVSVKFDVTARQIHVTRGLQVYAWEAYDAGGGVIESREVVKWTRELVGTIILADFGNLADVQDELVCQIWQAIVGTSRLPLTSVEAPLPAFTFGKLHYVYRSDADGGPMTDSDTLTRLVERPELSPQETVKVVEFGMRQGSAFEPIRIVSNLAQTKSPYAQGWKGWTRLWRELFNGVSLSPQTCLVRNAMMCMVIGLLPDELADVDGYLLRQLGQHLTAFDLVTFHHRGANYPDAILVDELLKRYLHIRLRFSGDDRTARMRRRALRQACLMRRHYEGHPVPDLPTSPGENARVMPASHPRVPEDQILHPAQRRRRLFADEPLTALIGDAHRPVLEQCIADLIHLEERVEMGLGLFIDRPLGYAKAIGEPDLTPMLAHEAFSPSIARRRWQELKKLCAELGVQCDTATLDPLFENGPWPAGLPHTEIAECPRPTAALCDVRKVADDFVILRTKPVGLAKMLEWCGIVTPHQVRLCVPIVDGAEQLATALFDHELRRVGVLRVDAQQGFLRRAGIEVPRSVKME